MNNLSNLSLLLGLFNQHVFPEAKLNAGYLTEYYTQNGMIDSNKLVKPLLTVIQTYKSDELTEGTFLNLFQRCGLSANESDSMWRKVQEYQSYTKEQAKEFCDALQRTCTSAYLNKIGKRFKNDEVAYQRAVANFDYKRTYSDKLSSICFSDIDPVALVEQYQGNITPSRYEFINKSSTLGGYGPDWVVIVTAPPSVGKSLFMMSEATHMAELGKKCHYLAMGDIGPMDFMSRCLCQISGHPQHQVERDIIGTYNIYGQNLGENLDITCVPAGTISAAEYVDWMLQHDEYEVCFVDYDSNFRQGGDNMYDRLGEVYEQLTRLTKAGKLVFVAAQPKISYYGEEKHDLGVVGESAR